MFYFKVTNTPFLKIFCFIFVFRKAQVKTFTLWKINVNFTWLIPLKIQTQPSYIKTVGL